MRNHSYENEFYLHVNEISFSYERMSTKTRFEKEAKGNSEMAYCSPPFFAWPDFVRLVQERLLRGLSLDKKVNDNKTNTSTILHRKEITVRARQGTLGPFIRGK